MTFHSHFKVFCFSSQVRPFASQLRVIKGNDGFYNDVKLLKEYVNAVGLLCSMENFTVSLFSLLRQSAGVKQLLLFNERSLQSVYDICCSATFSPHEMSCMYL